MAITNMRELFIDELGDIYDAEHRFLEGQQEMVQKVANQKLKSTVQKHIDQTQQQIRNLEQVFDQIGQQPQRKTCPVADGLLREARNNIIDVENEPLLDSVINVAVAKIEHYEIATYRSLIAIAQLLKQNEIIDLLRKNLQQEEETAQIAEQSTQELLQKIT